MRTIVASCLIAFLSTGIGSAQSRKTTQADFLVGQVTTTRAQVRIDLGYVHGFKRGHRFAVFRSDQLAWSPIGVIQVDITDSNSSRVSVVSGAAPAKGDLVLVAYSTLGTTTEKRRQDFYVTRRILFRRHKNGYDTRDMRVDTRQLTSQKKAGRRWYRRGEESGLRLTYGSTRDQYESDKVLRLASQCDLIREFQENAPGALRSLSPRWTRVLPEITGYVEPPAKKAMVDENSGETEEPDEDFANIEVRNMLPLVEREYEDDPRALREVFAMILGSVEANPPANVVSYIRSRLERSQFPEIARQPDTLRRLEQFVASLP
jgi:hypothetical protein